MVQRFILLLLTHLLLEKRNEVYYLEDGEYGFVKDGKVSLFNAEGERSFTKQALTADKVSAQKDGYRFFHGKRDL